MTPEEIEYIREWAAHGNEQRAGRHIPATVLWRCCAPIRVGGDRWALSESGLVIAAQAERIRELEHAVTIDRARQTREIETALTGLRTALACENRENEKLSERVLELEADRREMERQIHNLTIKIHGSGAPREHHWVIPMGMLSQEKGSDDE